MMCFDTVGSAISHRCLLPDLPCCYCTHPYYLTAHSCMSCTSAVCIVALLVATINSGVAEPGDPPCICLCLGAQSGPAVQSPGAVYPAFMLHVCPAGSAPAAGWVGAVQCSGAGWQDAAGQVALWICAGRWSSEEGVCASSELLGFAHHSGLTASDAAEARATTDRPNI